MKRKRKVFQTSEPAYRAFLKKFSENRNFDDACIIPALDYAFNEAYKSNVSLITRSHLVKVILESKEKIINDLDTLKDSPDSKIEPLGRKQRLLNNEIGETTKKRKLNNAEVSSKKTIIASESKENYPNKQSDERWLTKNKNSLTNVQKNKENQHTELNRKILKVTIENDKYLQDMAKSCSTKNSQNQNQLIETDTEKSDSNQQSTDTNQKENENLNEIQDHNESIEIEQSFLRVDENDTPFRLQGVCIKKEVDLLNDSLQGDIPIPLPEDISVAASNNASSLESDNQSNVLNSPLVSVNSQENVSSLNIACFNNFIPASAQVQPLNNFNQMPQMNCCPYMFLHHPMVMNSHCGCYHRMYNFPMINPLFSHMHHALPTFQNGFQAVPINQIAGNSGVANQSLPSTMQNPQISQIVGTSATNQLLSFQRGLQQQQANQMIENKCISQPLHLQSYIQSNKENQSLTNNPAAVLNAFQPVQQHASHQLMGNNYTSPQSSNTEQQFAQLHALISTLTSQVASLQNDMSRTQSK